MSPAEPCNLGPSLTDRVSFGFSPKKSHQYVGLKTENMTKEDYTVFVFNFEDT